jgi:site-specific recombinase XerD
MEEFKQLQQNKLDADIKKLLTESYDNKQVGISSYRKRKKCNKYQLEVLNRYYNHLCRIDATLFTKRNNLYCARRILQFFDKNIEYLTEEDVNRYITKISSNGYSPITKQSERIFLITFMKWFFGKEKQDIPILKNIKIKKVELIKTPDMMWKPEEIKKMLQIIPNNRDKAVVMLLYETAARSSEFLQLKIRDIEIGEQYGFVSIPLGKTKARKIPIIHSLPYVSKWINQHPQRDNTQAPLFISNAHKPLSKQALDAIIKKYAKQVSDKRLSAHLLRHAKLTELSKQLSVNELRIYAGWNNVSMCEVYVHLSGQDVSDKILSNAGLVKSNRANCNKVLQSIVCPRCETINGSEQKYCEKCSNILDIKEAQKKITSQEETIQVIVKDMLKGMGFDIKKIENIT